MADKCGVCNQPIDTTETAYHPPVGPPTHGRCGEADMMPRFTILGKDKLAVRALYAYAALVHEAGLNEQTTEVYKAIDEMSAWQRRHKDIVALPSHKHQPVPIPHRWDGEYWHCLRCGAVQGDPCDCECHP